MRIREQQGSAIINILGVSVAVIIVSMAIYTSLIGGIKNSMTEEARAEAESLSRNMLESVMYILLYEKVVYVDAKGPFDFSGGRGDITTLWAESFGAGADTDTNIAKACGGFDAKGAFIGTFSYNSIPVFCPVMLRSSQLNNLMLEQLLLENMVRKGVAKKSREGLYKIELVFYNKANGYDTFKSPVNQFLKINVGQNILNAQKNKLKSAKVTIEIATDSSGFSTTTSERFLTLTSELIFQENVLSYPITKSQSFVMYPATPRDFALFVAYPAKKNGENTRLWSESVKLTKNSVIDGRVFFNGDIDVAIQNLPTFNELVVITGDFVPALDKAKMAALKSKFLKGIVTKFSGPRFVFTGKCSQTNRARSVVNSAGYNCEISPGTPYNIATYLDKVGNVCMNAPVTSNNGRVVPDCSEQPTNCPITCTEQKIVNGPFKQATITGDYGFISAPVGVLTIEATQVYGTIFGGFIKSTKNVNIKAPALMKVGDLGIGSEDVLRSYTNELQKSLDGVSSPLLNMSIVKMAN